MGDLVLLYYIVVDVDCRNIQQQQVVCMMTLLARNYLDDYKNHHMLEKMNHIYPELKIFGEIRGKIRENRGCHIRTPINYRL